MGYAFATDIRTSYAHGDVTGNGPQGINVGGLVGLLNLGSTIEDSYATGSVNGTDIRNGGLVGTMGGNPAPTILSSFAAGTVNAPDNGTSGGLVGDRNAGDVVDAFYTDTQFGEGADKGTAITGVQLADESTFAVWDFVSTWEMDVDEGRPVLRWEAL